MAKLYSGRPNANTGLPFSATSLRNADSGTISEFTIRSPKNRAAPAAPTASPHSVAFGLGCNTSRAPSFIRGFQ